MPHQRVAILRPLVLAGNLILCEELHGSGHLLHVAEVTTHHGDFTACAARRFRIVTS